MRRFRLLSGVAAVAAVALTAAGLSAGARKPPPFVQTGNYRPVAWMQLGDSTRLADNFVGDAGATYDPKVGGDHPDPASALGNRYQSSLAFKWMHIGFSGDALNWQYVEREPGRYTIDPEVDQLINRWAAEGITVSLSMSVGFGENRPDVTRFADPREVERYKGYARFLVRHFKGRIGWFEIWNEPDTNTSFGEIPVDRYINLVRQVVPAIRAEDPNAKIAVGAIANTGIEYGFPGYGSYGRQTLDVAYLKALIGSGIAPLVDGISWHPFFGVRADDPYYRTYPQLAAELRRLARAAGFKGRFFAEEMNWPVTGDGMDPWSQPNSLTVVDKYLLRTVVTHRGLDFITIIATPQDSVRRVPHPIHAVNNVLAGATPAAVPAKIATKAKPLRSYGFTLPNGDRMLALWADGLPRDGDAGVTATLTLPGQAGHTATAVDPLRAQQQKLVTTRKNGSLVIRNLLVRDYPTFIRVGR